MIGVSDSSGWNNGSSAGKPRRWRILVAMLGVLGAACGNTVSQGDAATDVRDEGDLDLPRSSLCAQLEDASARSGDMVYCRLGAAEGEPCRTLPAPDGQPGFCVGVGASSGGVFAAYERNHRVPKICRAGQYGPVGCGQFGPGGPIPVDNICVPTFQAQCARFYPPDSGFLYACAPFHCD